MSVELVTGYFGEDSSGKPKRHVSSAEDGARQAGTVGLGCYALSTGSKLSATMEDANTLVVADGDVMMNGRHVSLPDPTSFTIPTGVQGQKVSNLAVLRYQKAADSVESVTPLVLTGEPSADTPIDPDYNEGSILDGDSPVDMPLYRVVTDGINAGDPEPLFDVLLPMAELSAEIDELRDSVSQLPSRIVVGTGVWSASAGSEKLRLWTKDQFVEEFGVAFNNIFDCAVAMNGDMNAQRTAKVLGCWYQNGDVGVNLSGHSTGPIRVNYVIFLH